MAAMEDLEKSLDEIFVKKAPVQLPKGAKEVIVTYLPWINAILGVIALIAAYGLWNAARTVDSLVEWSNNLTRAYGMPDAVQTSGLTLMVWVGIAVLAVEALLYILAFPATRDRKKQGWDLMFYALIINTLYGVVVLFTDHGGVGSLLGSILGTVIGLYFLFQIREKYLGTEKHKTAHTSAPVKK